MTCAGGGWRCKLADGSHQEADSIVRSTTLCHPCIVLHGSLTLGWTLPKSAWDPVPYCHFKAVKERLTTLY